jgi:hypothetical protein
MSNSHFDEIRRGGNALFSIFRVRPVRLDLENVLLDRPFSREASLILDRAVQLEKQGLQKEIDPWG